jgi:hypothetical protein
MHKSGKIYTYSPEAKKMFIEYSDSISSKMNAQWDSGSICIDNFSKDKRNFTRYD